MPNDKYSSHRKAPCSQMGRRDYSGPASLAWNNYKTSNHSPRADEDAVIRRFEERKDDIFAQSDAYFDRLDQRLADKA